MKKLIIAAFAVAFAAATQAATVVWGGAVATVDGLDYLPEGTQAALLYSATAFTGDATKLDSWAIGGVADNGGSVVGLYTMNAADAGNAAFSSKYTIEGGG